MFGIESKKKELSASPLWMSDELEYWPESAGRFTHIVALHSELIALSTTGQMHQWRWADHEPYRHPDVSTTITHLHYEEYNIYAWCRIHTFTILRQ